MTGLAAHGIRTAIAQSLTFVPVGPVTKRSPEPLEKSLGVVPGEGARRIEAALARPEKCLSVGQRAGGSRAAVDPVGARREDGDSFFALQGERGAERELEVSTAAAVAARELDRRLAAGEQHLPRPEPRGRPREPPPLLDGFPRKPPREKNRPQAKPSRLAGSGFQAQPVRSDDERHVAAPAANRRARADERGPIPRNVGEDERDETRRCPAAEPAPLIAESDARRRLISTIEAPDRMSRRTARRLASRVRPGRGSVRSDEVPPEMRQRITSRGPKSAK